MSLNKKYTWNDFLKQNPEAKAKKMKRTSKEGQKAFEAAYKLHVKEYLKERLNKIAKEQERVAAEKKTINAKLKKEETPCKARRIQTKLGSKDAYLARLEKMKERTKMLQKNI